MIDKVTMQRIEALLHQSGGNYKLIVQDLDGDRPESSEFLSIYPVDPNIFTDSLNSVVTITSADPASTSSVAPNDLHIDNSAGDSSKTIDATREDTEISMLEAPVLPSSNNVASSQELDYMGTMISSGEPNQTEDIKPNLPPKPDFKATSEPAPQKTSSASVTLSSEPATGESAGTSSTQGTLPELQIDLPLRVPRTDFSQSRLPAAIDSIDDLASWLIDSWQILIRELSQYQRRRLASLWVKVIEPKKRHQFPYRHGEHSRPEWWPQSIKHIEPSKLFRHDLILLTMCLSLNERASPEKLLEAATTFVPERSNEKAKIRKLLAIAVYMRNRKITYDDIVAHLNSMHRPHTPTMI